MVREHIERLKRRVDALEQELTDTKMECLEHEFIKLRKREEDLTIAIKETKEKYRKDAD